MSLINPFVNSYSLGNMLDEFDNQFFRHFPLGVLNRNRPPMNTFKVDMQEKDTEFVVRADLPGFSSSDVSVEYTGGDSLTITAKRDTEKTSNDVYHYSERSYGEFMRMLKFPKPVSDENIHATFEDGVLSVVVPKKQHSTSRKIQITTN